MTATTTNVGRFEHIATAASVLCAAECAARPFALLLLPLFGIKLFDSELLEYGLIALVFILGLGNILYRMIKQDHSFWPLLVFVVGFTALITAHFALGDDSLLGTSVAVTGALTIAVSQFLNRRISHDCCEYHKTMEGNDG
jgi:hypothetical protein